MNLNRPRAVLLSAAFAYALTCGTTRGLGADPPKGERDPRAAQLLNEVIGAYRALPAYADKGEFVLTTVVDGQTRTQRAPLQLTLVRPNKLSLETGLARVVSDGTTLTTVVAPLKKFFREPAPKAVTFETVFAGGPVGSSVFGGPSGPMMLVVLNLLLGDDPAKALLDLGDRLTLGDDRALDGNPCRVLRLASDEGGLAYFLLIDPGTKLLRAIELTFDPKALAETMPDGQGVKIDTFRWTPGEVSTGPAADSAFAFNPPKDFTAIDEPAAAAPADEADEILKVKALVGKPAPDFTLTVLDGDGKTRTLSKADLAGKVVVIDFWATWCPPCLAELPEVQKLVEAYAGAKKDVVIVALSQDDEPRDPVEVRKLIETTLEERKIVLTGAPVGRVGIDPSNSVGDAFQVKGYPTLVVLDPAGVVRAAHVGIVEDVGKRLGAVIDALIAGKTIEKDPFESKK